MFIDREKDGVREHSRVSSLYSPAVVGPNEPEAYPVGVLAGPASQ